ncbi:type II toxin-antitoxin system ParD family antitoxin [Beijerinckia sp. L45]|uniref:ribbon-helix-helix domain-containing protein n=1 Tax=Beijerinckia sp. L45 TaxID=1641855 RepID=UPI001FEEA481|nr:type II toxin-antitoxin system ParD family antitoxin [Beijerinckia sp. L45]
MHDPPGRKARADWQMTASVLLSIATGGLAMPIRKITLTAEQDASVDGAVSAGVYADADEAMRDAVRGLQQRHQEDDLKLKVLRTQVDTGIAALDRGDFVEVDDADLDDYLDDLNLGRSRLSRGV